jgi:hypothetical protein
MRMCTRDLRFRLAIGVFMGFLWGASAFGADLNPGGAFRVRGRVLESGGIAVSTNAFKFTFAGSNVWAQGTNWSDWIHASCPAARVDPAVMRIGITGGSDPCKAQVQTQVEGQDYARTFDGTLFASQWGLLVWKWEGQLLVATMAEFNRMFWNNLPPLEKGPVVRPRDFPIADRFISGDNDRVALHEGIAGLARAGFSALKIDNGKIGHEYLLQTGLKRTTEAVYCPPGGPFDHSISKPQETMDNWVNKIVAPLTNAGFATTDLALMTLADEPGWYYPSCFIALTNNPVALSRFRDYLKNQGLSPADLGARTWADVWPKGHSQALDLPSRRLFYWTMRFFPWDSARYYADCTRALESVFYTNLPVFVNWNFFSGRYYVPGPVANNRDRKSPDAAMGGQDWMEFGRMRGATMLWTEDWFGDELAYQWSYYCARLGSAARLGGVEYGGYIVPRSAGSRPEGIIQKAAAIVGHGGKAIEYFVFGPEYNFPGNCYSRSSRILIPMTEAHRLIAIAEPLLWPGRPRPSDLAILMPRSAQVWDPNGISDATNVRLNGSTVDYMTEVYNLFLAFMHANIPVDFVEEDQLTVEGLKGIKVLYVTEPNVPEENQKQLVTWVSKGGTLVTVAGAAQCDRYNEPCRVLSKGLGIAETARERMLVGNVYAFPGNGAVTGRFGQVSVVGTRSTLESEKGLSIQGRFEDGTPALVSRDVGKGRAFHYNWMPGMAYARSPQNHNGMLVDWDSMHRAVILDPALQSGIRAAVRPDRPMVEAPLLESPAGAVVTLLNWTDEPVTNLVVEMDYSRPVREVSSAAQGPLKFEQNNGIVRWSVPVLKGADFVMLRP